MEAAVEHGASFCLPQIGYFLISFSHWVILRRLSCTLACVVVSLNVFHDNDSQTLFLQQSPSVPPSVAKMEPRCLNVLVDGNVLRVLPTTL